MNSNFARVLTKSGSLRIGAGAIVFCLLSQPVTSTRILRAAAGIAPFTLETEVYTSSGLLDRRTEARRSDGSEVFIGGVLCEAGIRAGAKARKVSFADGRTVTLVDSIAAKTTWPRSPAEQANRLNQFLADAPADCVYYPGERLLGHDSVLGQRTAVVSATQFAEGADQKLTRWRAVSLGCKTLKYRLEAKNRDGSRHLLAEEKPLILKLGEPVPALFDTGENYVELKPSQQWRLEAQHFGIGWNPPAELEKSKDAIYLGLAPPAK
jgi:hypothetical protein